MGHWHSDGTYHSDAHADSALRRVRIVFGLTVSFMILEFIGGWLTNSLALTADASHMATDSAALALTLVSIALSKRRSSPSHSYGYHRAEILGAFINGVFLFGLALVILYNAILRVRNPEPVDALSMIGVATLGLVVNLLAGWLLHKGSHHNLAMRAALLHVIGDALGSVGAVVAGLSVYFGGWLIADPIASLVVAVLIIITSSGFIRETAHVILQGVPKGQDLRAIESRLRAVPGIQALHDLHLWSLTPVKPVLTVHVVYDAAQFEPNGILLQVKSLLAQEFGISHSTIQMETKDLDDGCHEANQASHPH